LLLDFDLKASFLSTGRRGLFGLLVILFHAYVFLIARHWRRSV